MYKAKKEFTSYKYGKFSKGDEAPFNAEWLDAGLIEEAKPTKPAPRAKKETKPHKEG